MAAANFRLPAFITEPLKEPAQLAKANICPVVQDIFRKPDEAFFRHILSP